MIDVLQEAYLMRGLNRPVASAIAAMLTVAAVAVIAPAAPTAEVTVGPRASKGGWRGEAKTGLNVGTLEGVECPSAAQDPQNAVCDHIIVKVDVPPSYWGAARHGGVRITLKDANGLQLFVYNPAGMIVGEAADGDSPSAYIPNASGTYEIRVNPYIVFFQEYTGEVQFITKKGRDPGFARHGASAFKGRTFNAQPSSLPQNKAVTYRGPKLSFASYYIGRKAAEPTIGIDKKGGVLYPASAFDALPSGSPRQLARTEYRASFDNGKTWRSVQPPTIADTSLESEPTSLDPYVYVDVDSGRWFGVDLKGAGTSIQFSDDQGKSWTRAFASNPGFNDHQTLASGPVPKGSNLVTTDPAFKNIVYYCTNQVYSALCQRSLDGGRTYVQAGQSFPPVDPGAMLPERLPFCGALHGHVVADYEGRVAIPRGHCQRPWISVSEDAGMTWKQTKVSDTIGSDDSDAAAAFDAAGNLYFTWLDDVWQMPYLSVSRDHGNTWSMPRMIAPPGVRDAWAPTIVAGDAGRVAVTFVGSPSNDRTDMSRPWNQYIVMTTDGLARDPLFLSAVANPGGAGDPVHRGFCNQRCGNLYDFQDIQMAPDRNGTIWVAAADTCTAFMKCNTTRVTGATGLILGQQDGASGDMQGVAIRQTGGPTLRKTAATRR